MLTNYNATKLVNELVKIKRIQFLHASGVD